MTQKKPRMLPRTARMLPLLQSNRKLRALRKRLSCNEEVHTDDVWNPTQNFTQAVQEEAFLGLPEIGSMAYVTF